MKYTKTISYKLGGKIHIAEIKPDYISDCGIYAFIFEKLDGGEICLLSGELIEIN